MDINLEDFSEPQAKVIKAICVHQLDSLNRILDKNPKGDIDLTMFLIQNEIAEEELMDSIEAEVKKYEELYNDPDNLRILSKKELSMFKHLLANIEKEWAIKYPNATKNLWHRLHIIEEVQGNKYTSNQMN